MALLDAGPRAAPILACPRTCEYVGGAISVLLERAALLGFFSRLLADLYQNKSRCKGGNMGGAAILERFTRPLQILAAVLLLVIVACQLADGVPPVLGYFASIALIAELWFIGLFSFGAPHFGATALEHVFYICVCLYYLLAIAVLVGIVAFLAVAFGGSSLAAAYARIGTTLAMVVYIGFGVLCNNLASKITRENG